MSVDVVEFDEEAEMQARMWNGLVRRNGDESDLIYMVTTESVSLAKSDLYISRKQTQSSNKPS